MSFLPNQAIYPLSGAIEALAQRAAVELMSWMHSRSLSAVFRQNRVYACIFGYSHSHIKGNIRARKLAITALRCPGVQ
jgi:hypothetical protein